MLYLTLALLTILLSLAMRLFYCERQIESLIKQLTDINEKKIDKKITIGLQNRKIERLCEKINESIEIKKQSESNKIKIENDLRQTIANMSHDIRTPLTSIIGYIQFLKLDNISEDERDEYLDIAEDRAKVLEKMLNDFYELSLIESLDYELDLEKLNINKLLKEAMLGKYINFVDINIDPNLEMPKDNIYIIAEERSLKRVIENILDNAIKYAKDNIIVSLEVEDDRVVLKVSNDTRNIDLSDIENIFDRFYIGDKTRSGKSTGLGLAIAKGLVEKMKGNITASVEGSVFNIYCNFKIVND